MQAQNDQGRSGPTASTTAKRPEEVGVLESVCDVVLAIWSDDRDLEDVVHTESDMRRKNVVSTAKRPSTGGSDGAFSANTTCNRQVLAIYELVGITPLNARVDGYS